MGEQPMSHDSGHVGQVEKAEIQSAGSANEVIHATRPARALIGWMTLEQAKLSLAGRRLDQADRPDFAERAERARLIVASRPSGVNQTGLVSPAPDILSNYIEGLRQNPAGAQYFNESWRVEMVDLSRVCAAQPHVTIDHATERMAASAPKRATVQAGPSPPSTVPAP